MHGVAPGEAVECPSANAAVMRAEALSRKPGCAERARVQPNRRSGDRRIRRCQADPKVRRRARRLERAVRPTKLVWVRNEITRMRSQIRAQEREIRMLQRADISTALLLSRMRTKLEDLCREREVREAQPT